MVQPALLPLMRTPLLPVVDSTDASADLNGLVRFAERRNLVSARVPSHFKRSLTTSCFTLTDECCKRSQFSLATTLLGFLIYINYWKWPRHVTG